MAGPKPKLTKALIETIEKSLTSHNTKKTTCEMVGIGQTTFYRWLEEGELARSGLKRELWESVKRAQSISKTILVNQIAKDPNWQAKAWLLERMHPEEFGRQQRVEMTGRNGGPIGLRHGGAVTLNLTMQASEEEPWEFEPDTEEAESQIEKP